MAATTIGYRPDKKAIANDKKAFKDRAKKPVQESKVPKELDGGSGDNSNGQPEETGD